MSPTNAVVVKWAVKVANWSPSTEEFKAALSEIQTDEHEKVLKFMLPVDRKRALVGRLLAKRLILHFFPDQRWDQVRLSRTEYQKPFWAPGLQMSPAFHFNYSHHGDWVVISGHLGGPIGVDVTNTICPSNTTVEAYLGDFKSFFSTREWQKIRAGNPSEATLMHRFACHWCLKESYTKALGVGLGLDFWKVEFLYDGLLSLDEPLQSRISVYVNGALQPGWIFELGSVDATHPVCVAYSGSEGVDAASRSPSPFVVKDICDLLS
ncbi:4'-phosphopantetheinyl transferase superfamily [Polychytrium aggregatum]|uniref:4'-phosphopantetheinyl transferase superfamily n=1 Tax=Polychytrium aggregatum TaxID=110093 RepID=UPI0022FE6E7E|nr:4'-phosphopantetheinyl transferase superfamily [Polychytrium aggregatum]KAI9197497.1 4'-phosphopantetheinyl transferase superfamily [Polychytrium aggregatum]